MRPSTKASLKSRIREYETLQRSHDFRQADAQERTEARAAYLEDLLRLYQSECEVLVDEKERAALSNDTDLTREIDRLTDTNYHLSQKVKALHAEVAQLRAEREKDVSEVTAGFQRQLERNKERMKMSSSTMQNENAVLKAKVDQLEAYVREQRALVQAEEEVRVIELQYIVDDLRAELAEKSNEVETERRERTRMEDELVQMRQQQHELLSFIDALGDTADRVREIRERGADSHGQLVEQLLRSSQALLREHVSNSKKAAAVQRGLQQQTSIIGSSHADEEPASGEEGSQSAVVSAAVNDKLAEANRLLRQRQEALKADGIGATADAAAGDGGGAAGGGAPGSRTGGGGGSNPSAVLAGAIAGLQSALEAQQIEVVLAARVSLDAHEATLRETQGKLLNSYAQCEHLVARAADLERQAAEAREQCAAERDRALNLRDQAILQLRTREVRDTTRTRRHVETQTVGATGRGTATIVDQKPSSTSAAAAAAAGSSGSGGATGGGHSSGGGTAHN